MLSATTAAIGQYSRLAPAAIPSSSRRSGLPAGTRQARPSTTSGSLMVDARSLRLSGATALSTTSEHVGRLNNRCLSKHGPIGTSISATLTQATVLLPDVLSRVCVFAFRKLTGMAESGLRDG